MKSVENIQEQDIRLCFNDGVLVYNNKVYVLERKREIVSELPNTTTYVLTFVGEL